ncbi:DUF4307 domain-containing protein [Paeniglutamicibacter kerguelensis]|uniref:DUF4307 domain-containing protein n=1 Tax=Paeniglutamicibacter kerguelensis TaxID=254788 RepID=A0ABS4X9A8_9MICC|nr:DUF4307 domain-containing protein [Paeniglutamicibacter kerguelensis]MBP2384896.1 hypothetical protein [Paeniglutamicibacter kerguelensis]
MSSLTNRYGSPKRRLAKKTRRNLIIGGLSVGVIGALYLAWATNSQVEFKDNSFMVNSPTQARALVDITKDAKDTAQCEVRAMNESYAIVGWKTLTIGPSEGTGRQTMRFDVNLRTESLATTVGVEECKIVKPS